MEDKDYTEISKILAPLASKIFVAAVGSERAADPRLLVESCREANPAASPLAFDNLALALDGASDEPSVVITGSLHLVGEAMELLGLAASSGERALNEYTAGAKAKSLSSGL
jgi:folylpolyglutamate synthase/dihydropteroate synthase